VNEAPRPGAPFDRLVHDGLAQRAAADLTASIASFRAACRLRPRHAGARIELGLSLRLAGRYAAARDAFQAALRVQPSNARGWLECGRAERALGEFAGARTAFERAAGLGNERARVELATLSFAAGDPTAAASIYEDILARSPSDFDAGLGLAQLQATALQFEACIARCDELIGRFPDRLAPLRLKCMALIRLDLGDQALSLAERLDGGATGRPDVEAIRLEVCRAASRRAQALECLARWHGATDRPFAYWTQGVLTLLAFFELPAAAAALRAPPARLPQEWARVRQLEAILADLQWRTDDAIDAFERSLAEDAHAGVHAGGSHQSLGRLYFLRADAAAATLHLERRLQVDASALVLQGASRRVSQSLLGQLVNELRLDAPLERRLERIARRAPARRLARLLALVRGHPGSTPAAIALLLALRQDGAFDARGPSTRAAPGTEARIPRRIVQYWDQPEPPAAIVELMRGWAEAHPGYVHECFDDAAARAFLERHFPPEVRRAYARAAHPAQASDLFRLAALYAQGGFYVDADDRCVGHLAAVTDPAADFIAYQEEYATLGNNFIAAAPGEPLFGAALQQAVGALLRGDAELLWLATGPGLLTRVFAGALAARGSAWPQALDGRRILDRRAIAAVVRPHTLLHYKHSERSWSQGLARRI
jgi:tetratricopeptide (TPR) repeat protein